MTLLKLLLQTVGSPLGMQHLKHSMKLNQSANGGAEVTVHDGINVLSPTFIYKTVCEVEGFCLICVVLTLSQFSYKFTVESYRESSFIGCKYGVSLMNEMYQNEREEML